MEKLSLYRYDGLLYIALNHNELMKMSGYGPCTNVFNEIGFDGVMTNEQLISWVVGGRGLEPEELHKRLWGIEVEDQTLSLEEVDQCLNSDSVFLRFITVMRKDFTPTKTQYDKGLADESKYIRDLWLLRLHRDTERLLTAEDDNYGESL